MENYQQKKILILGVTGSIGSNTLSIIRNYPEQFQIVGVSFHSNIEKANGIIEEFSIKHISITNSVVANSYINENCVIHESLDSLLAIDFDYVVIGIIGSGGLLPVLKAIEQEKVVLLANKESIVMGGGIIQQTLLKYPNAKIIPLDSEHNSVYRMIVNIPADKKDIHKMILTASGGPFLRWNKEKIATASKKDVLNHPVWEMGNKITVDSAGLINKALEIIEAHFLFSIPYSQIDAVMHPSSFFHAIIEHQDGTYTMHASVPDMRYPIAFGLFYPSHPPYNIQKKSLPDITNYNLEFLPIPKEKFPGFYLGIQSGIKGGGFPSVFYASNECAVELFLEGSIQFYQIPLLIEKTLDQADQFRNSPDLEEIQYIIEWARKTTLSQIR